MSLALNSPYSRPAVVFVRKVDRKLQGLACACRVKDPKATDT